METMNSLLWQEEVEEGRVGTGRWSWVKGSGPSVPHAHKQGLSCGVLSLPVVSPGTPCRAEGLNFCGSVPAVARLPCWASPQYSP